MERRIHALERRENATQLGQVACTALEAARHNVRDEVLLEPHVRIGIGPGDLGLDHPEFRQVPARLRFLGAERGTEAIDLAERSRRGFDVELPRLREIGLAEVEVIDRKQRSGMLADRSGENRRVHECEVALVEKVANRLDDFITHARDRDLLFGAQPEMAVLEQIRDAVLFWRDREVDARPDDREIGRLQLDTARGPRIRMHDARHFDRRLLSKFPERFPDFGSQVFLGEHRLQIAAAVPQHDERDLAARAGRGDPAAHRDGLPREARKFLDPMTFRHRGGILVAGLFSVNAMLIACAPVTKQGPARQESAWLTYLGTPRHDAAAHETLNPDPRPLWHVAMGRGVRGSPALGETVVAVGTADRNIVLLDRASGEILWRSHLDGTVRAGPLLDEDRLYVATESQPDGRVYAVRLRDGRRLWRTRVGSVTAPIAFDSDAIFAATEEGLVLRLEPERGMVRWRCPLSGAVRAGPLVTPNGLVVATTTDTLFLIDRQTGTVRSHLSLPGAVLATPATDGRR